MLLSCGDDDAPAGPDGGTGGRASGGAAATGGAPGSGGKGSGGRAPGGAGGASGGVPDGGAGAPADWAGCPGALDYLGDPAWPHRLTVKDGAVYCAAFNEERTLVEELAAKAMLRVAPGTYPLPGTSRDGIGLPLCFRFGETGAAVGVTEGDVTYDAQAPQYSYRFAQPLTSGPGAPRSFGGTLMDRAENGAPVFVLDGSETDFRAQDAIYYFSLCAAEGCAPYYGFDSCTHAATGSPHRHQVTLDAGEVTFELNITPSFSSTEPASFVRASGTYRGVAFDQHSYWKLIYSPAHHHFVRSFAVLFDEPIEGACGLSVQGLEPGGDDREPDAAAAVNCELGTVAELQVTAHEHVRP